MRLDEDITTDSIAESHDDDASQVIESVAFDFGPGVSRRSFVQLLGAGIVISMTAGSPAAEAAPPASREGQRRGGGGGRGGPPINLGARIHIADDGTITILTGKVEGGQGARQQLTQAAAEELRIAPEHLRMIMADTDLVPDDGGTYGSQTTPRTVPAVRQACAAARDLLIALAAETWKMERGGIEVRDGAAVAINGAAGNGATSQSLAYSALIKADRASEAFKQAAPRDVQVFAVREWKVLGTPMPRPNRHDLVTGAHHYPSDIILPGMLYGKILRPPAFGAKLASIDLAPAQRQKDAVVVRDQSFVGVAATTTWQAKQALAELEKAAQWETPPHPSSSEIFEYLRQNAQGGIPANPHSDLMASAAKSLKAKYDIAYVQHAPMEPRTATAQWSDGKLTVWTATQRPFDVRRELANAFRIPEERVQVIIPDFGGGFGGKHTGECAIEASRLAQAAGKPVGLRWTRAEEFTWAAFRPAAAIDVEASLDDQGRITSWHFININSGQSSIESPYNIESKHSQYVESAPPLRHSSYRALAATANTFARECFMDELAHAAGIDPLGFRRQHLDAGSRLRGALEDAAVRFEWSERRAANAETGAGERHGVGLACGTEKGSFVAACAEVAVDVAQKSIRVLRITQTFDCGAITSPRNLMSQVQGAIVMGLGPALREEMIFKDGKMLNAAFKSYTVPRMSDVPEMDVHLLDRPDVPSAGAGETPLIAVAPAVGNAIFHATGMHVRRMPMRLAEQSAGDRDRRR